MLLCHLAPDSQLRLCRVFGVSVPSLPRDSDLSCDSPESVMTDTPGSGDIYLHGLRSFKIIFAPPSPATEHIAVEAYLIA